MGSPEETFVRAILDRKADLARKMLDRNADLARAVVWHGLTPLHAAAETGDAALARELLASGADVNALSEWGHDPATWAVVCGAPDVARVLIEAGAPQKPLVAAGLGRTGDLPEDCPADAFWIAARNGHLDTARKLRSRGADLETPGWMGGRAVHWAAYGGHVEVVKWLLEEGADPTRKDNEPGKDAAGWATEGRREAGGHGGDYARIYRLLARAGAKPLIFDWIDLGDATEVRRMLDGNPRLIDARRNTATPLHVAVDEGRIEIVRVLLDYAPELSLEDGAGRTPLMIALQKGRTEIADLLRRRIYFD